MSKREIICEFCREEVTDDMFYVVDDNPIHAEDCFMEYVSNLPFISWYKRDEYLKEIEVHGESEKK